VNRRESFWIGISVLVGLASFGPVSTAGAQAASQQSVGAQRPAQSARPASTTATARRPRTTAAQRRAAATAREMADTVVPRYKVDASGDLVPDVRAAAAIILDARTGDVLWEENSLDQRSIASITKVMTATVVLANEPDFSEKVKIVRSDVYRASTTLLRAGDTVTVEDLLHLLLMPSDNAAARALARVSPQGSAGFITRMNEKAIELGLENTQYADPSGLLSDNVSSAYDMARLIAMASSDPKIGPIMRKAEYTIQTPTRKITLRNTNHLLGKEEFDVLAGKTGFIRKAGYCLATLLRLPQSGHEVAVVVLGARTNAGRFMETQNLLSWLSNRASSIFATATPATQ
jgi:D-alanyl-D-alanine endopeptidase (penicillin-binding protein 7)